MTDVVELLAEGDDGSADGGRRGMPQPRPWWAWTLAALGLGTIALVAAGVVLADEQFGTSLRSRACDAALLPGFGLLALGALLVATGCTLSRMHVPGSVLEIDGVTLPIVLPAPVALLALTLPGVLGCAAASDISALALVGEGLVGQSGIVLAAASAVLVGVALAACLQVSRPAHDHAHPDGESDLVELAMEEADALRAHVASGRFRGVDSGH